MRAFLLCCLLGLAAASLHTAEIRHHAKTANRMLISNFGSHRFPLQGVTLECLQAINTFNTTIHSAECGAVFAAFDSHATSDVLETTVTAHCTGDYQSGKSCNTVIGEQLATVRDECLSDTVVATYDILTRIAMFEGIYKAAYATLVPCVQDSANNLCIPRFARFIENVAAMEPGDLFTAEQLDTGCTECTRRVIEVWAAFQPVDAIVAALRIGDLCMRRENEYCVIHIQEVSSASTATVDTQLGLFCHPCTVAFTSRALALSLVDATLGGMDPSDAQAIIDSYTTFRVIGEAICVRDLRGNFCLGTFANATDLFAQVNDTCSLPSADLNDLCPSGCSAALTALKTDAGCCFGTLFELANLGLLAAGEDTTGIQLFIQDICDVNIGASCTALRWRLAVTVVFDNIDLNQYRANPDAFLAAIRNSLAYALGVSPAQLVGLAIRARATRNLLSGSLTVTTDVHSNSEDLLKSANDNLGDAIFTGVNGLSASYRSDPTAPVGAVATSSLTTPTPNTSGASSLAPMLFIALLPLLALYA